MRAISSPRELLRTEKGGIRDILLQEVGSSTFGFNTVQDFCRSWAPPQVLFAISPLFREALLRSFRCISSSQSDVLLHGDFPQQPKVAKKATLGFDPLAVLLSSCDACVSAWVASAIIWLAVGAGAALLVALDGVALASALAFGCDCTFVSPESVAVADPFAPALSVDCSAA